MHASYSQQKIMGMNESTTSLSRDIIQTWSASFYFLPVSWKEWLAFPLETCLVLSKELKSRASYILRVPDIEIPTIPQKEM